MAGLSQRRAALVARLRVAKTRAAERAVLVEGVRAVREALDAGVDVRFAVSSPRLETTEEGRSLAERLEALDLTRMDDEDLPGVSDTEHSQGVLLVAEEPDPPGAAPVPQPAKISSASAISCSDAAGSTLCGVLSAV